MNTRAPRLQNFRTAPDSRPERAALPDLPTGGLQIGLDAEPRLFGGGREGIITDTRTGIPPIFNADARARWASEREARGLEAFLSRRC